MGGGFKINLRISIHALREESDPLTYNFIDIIHQISIHALREESDIILLLSAFHLPISIHALREESD